MKKSSCKLNDTFGSWTVISNDTFVRSGHTYVKDQCKCGKIEDKCLSDLRNGRSSSCRSCAARSRGPQVKIGDKYKSWTVTGGPKLFNGTHMKYEVQCDCGTIKKDKFNNEITFIIPYWADLEEKCYQYWDDDWVDGTDKDKIPDTILKHFTGDSSDIFLSQCESAEVNYKALINRGHTAQEAREILPLCTKTELVMTGTISQWKEFFNLRSPLSGAKGVHPQAAALADNLYKEFKKRNYLNN